MTATLTHAPDVTDKFTTSLIRRTARKLIDEGKFQPRELEDVIQDLRTALLEQISNFDPERARWSTFVKNVVRLTAISLCRRQDAECRKGQRDTRSLNVLIKDEDDQPAELGAIVSEEQYRWGLGQEHYGHTSQVDTALDVETVIDWLPEELREVALLLKDHSVAQIARRLNIPRTTITHRIGKIRQALVEAGYGN